MLATIDELDRVPQILRLDLSGHPVKWISWKEAVYLYARELVRWTWGDFVLRLRGGRSRLTGDSTYVDVASIIACAGRLADKNFNEPPLTNRALFARDHHRCMYCGSEFAVFELTRDHVVPRSQGGTDRWDNVVAACRRCNHFKGNRMPHDCGMHLLAHPYVPNLHEFLALSNSGRVLGDQMTFLQNRFGEHGRSRRDLVA